MVYLYSNSYLMSTNSKTYRLIIWSLLFTNSIFGQTTISSSGDDYNTPQTQLSWTLGESIVTTVNSSNTYLTQGFHQGKQIILSVPSFYPVLQIKAFPNPTSAKLNINISNNSDPWVIRIYDLSGKLLLYQSYSGIQFKTTLDISSYTDGMYLINVSTNLQTQQIQILKTQ